MSRKGPEGRAQSTPLLPAGAPEEVEHVCESSMAIVAQNSVVQVMDPRWIKLKDNVLDKFKRALPLNEVASSGEEDSQGKLNKKKSLAALQSSADLTPKLPGNHQKPLTLFRSVKRSYDDDNYGDKGDVDGENGAKKMKIASNGTNGTLSSDSGRVSLEEDEWVLSPTTVRKAVSSLHM